MSGAASADVHLPTAAARDCKSGAYIEVIGGRMDMPPLLAYAHGRLDDLYGKAP
jgi:indolepyruvate decarboxylase